MFNWNKTPLQHILDGSHTTRQMWGYAQHDAIGFAKWLDAERTKYPDKPIEKLYEIYRVGVIYHTSPPPNHQTNKNLHNKLKINN